LDLRTLPVKDYGDAGVASLPPAEAFEPLKAAFRTVLAECSVAVILGGDNAVTRPGIHSLGVPLRRCALLTVDAHLDLRDLDRGLTNGNPVRALLRDGLPGSNIVQVGIQSFANSRAYFEIARAEGITVVTADTVRREGIRATMDRALSTLADRADVIYVDFDIDVMDRALAPATPGSRPGGLATWEARQAAFLCGIHPKVRAVDFVEMDPSNDIAEVTAMAAAACLLEFTAGFGSRGAAKETVEPA
jgi:formiminoglutamase